MEKVKQQVPRYRFPEFKGAWQVCEAGELYSNSKAKGEEGLPIYSVTMRDGLIRRDAMDRVIMNDAAPESSLKIEPGYLAYNMMRMWQGAVGLADKEGMVSGAYVVLKPKRTIHSPFAIQLFNRSRSIYDFNAYSYGLTSDRLRLYYQDFSEIKFHIPILPEQQKIAAFLGAVDRKIQQLKRKQELLERYKKGVVQELFSQELRFKRKDGGEYPEWKEKTLGDLCNCHDNRRKPLNSEERQGMQGNIPYWGANNIVDHVNDFIFDETIVLLAEDGGYFEEYRDRPIAQISHGKSWVNNHAHVLTAKKGMSNEFLYLSLVNKNILGYINAGTRSKLNKSDMLRIEIAVPSLEEQSRIAGFLMALDAKVAGVAQAVAAAQKWKRGLLQQMFV